MTEKKNYTERQERIARFAKALGHPARIAIMEFLAKQLWSHTRRAADIEGYRVATSQRTERRRTHTR